MEYNKELEEFTWEYGIGMNDFEHAFKRKPKNHKEFEDFAYKCEQGTNAQLDWGIIVQCAKESMEGE